MIGWIMKCVTSTSFSLSINGTLHGYFKGKQGLRQGDLMPPYLFTLVIEVLTLMLHRRARVLGSFTYHRHCSKLNLINLCFADDLFLFAHGEVDSARVIMNMLVEFKEASGLTPSLPKITAYFCNVLNHTKLNILNILPFEEGEMKMSKAKVAWKVVCLPKKEGVLGIRRLEIFNKALISSHIWSLLMHKESLWVKWIHSYKLNGRSFWEIPIQGKMSWGWRKILQVRNIVHPFIWCRLGDGSNASAWFDNWCLLGPLSDIISNRDIYSASYNRSAKVKYIIVNTSWSWPDAWMSKYSDLGPIEVPHLTNINDTLVWKDLSNVDVRFSVVNAWECIRPRFNEVDWYHVVWFSNQIPHHVIHLWLVIKCKLKTQDNLRKWDVWEQLKRFTSIPNIPSRCYYGFSFPVG
ncbi:hypothetical protein Tco_0678048 [Tanacetum coccineum]|uniref:Reverse transcriptase domain-containing protein n=1 Tax=Tanacetum coccineum TaxID=301880 RepID=A0ABQ4XDW9_9ASTR